MRCRRIRRYWPARRARPAIGWPSPKRPFVGRCRSPWPAAGGVRGCWPMPDGSRPAARSSSAARWTRQSCSSAAAVSPAPTRPTYAAAGSATCRSPAPRNWNLHSPGDDAGHEARRGSLPPMSSAEHIAETVNRYISLIAKGTADDLVELYADDATVEDPVGGEVHIGRQAIRGFYSSVENIKADADVTTLRALGHEVAFLWVMSVDLGEAKMQMEIISVMTFDGEGKIASMKAYWGPDN